MPNGFLYHLPYFLTLYLECLDCFLILVPSFFPGFKEHRIHIL